MGLGAAGSEIRYQEVKREKSKLHSKTADIGHTTTCIATNIGIQTTISGIILILQTWVEKS